ncbi:hypothetical protein E1176_18695, partial [Fulvivirga sp. RKSG066]|uniref:hypothetical protein n=1 Tax=Fulvivirga aurantia TaxID=2529383 RepID=UPI0012BB558A
MNSFKIAGLLLIACFYAQCSSAQQHDDAKSKVATATYSENKQLSYEEVSGNYYVELTDGKSLLF